MKKLIVFLAAIAMVGTAVATASAAVDLYGSVRFRTYYNSYDSDYFGGGTSDSYGTTEWKMDGLTRLGANFKFGDVTGKWEIDGAVDNAGLDQTGSGGSARGGLRTRLAYGVWNFGCGSILIGQDYPLTDYYVTSVYHTDNGFQGWGGLGITEARIGQIKLKFGGLQFAAVTPYTKVVPQSTTGAATYNSSENAYIPKLEARYDGKIGKGFSYMLVGGLQTYDANNYAEGKDGDSENILSYVLAVAAKYNYKGFTIGALGKYAQNAGNYGLCTGNPASSIQTFGKGAAGDVTSRRADVAYIVGNEVKDATTWSGLVSVGYKFNELFSAEAGYGYVNNAVWNREDEGQAAYLQARFTVAPGVYIVPEFLFYDAMKSKVGTTETEDGSLTTVGVMWRIDFK